MTTENQDNVITLMDVRLSYFYGFQPIRGKNDQGKETVNYCTHAIFAPNSPAHLAVKALQLKVAKAGWPSSWENVLKELSGKDKLVLHDGNISKPGQDGYADNFFVSANGKVRPTIIETRGGVNVPLVESDGRPYSGCYANVMVSIWAQDAEGKKPSGYGKRINAQLMGVQFVCHGESFGGGRVAKPEEFGLVATDADAAPAAAPADAAAGLY